MDISRLNDQGFVLQKLRNYWSDDKYNGINSVHSRGLATAPRKRWLRCCDIVPILDRLNE